MCQGKCSNCRECEWGIAVNSGAEEGTLEMGYMDDGYQDFYCSHKSFASAKPIDYYSLPSEKVDVPSWCPLGYANKRKPKTYTDEARIIDNVKGMIEWDDIQVGQVYHLPRLFREKRKDILIVTKTQYMITYRDINSQYAYSEYLYKSNGKYRFLVQHKVQEIETPPPPEIRHSSYYYDD